MRAPFDVAKLENAQIMQLIEALQVYANTSAALAQKRQDLQSIEAACTAEQLAQKQQEITDIEARGPVALVAQKRRELTAAQSALQAYQQAIGG